MFSKIWHGSLIAAIVFYAGNIFFATTPCERVDRTGSVVRVGAVGIFFLSDNWMTKADQLSVRKQAHKLDIWVQDVMRITFFGKDLKCVKTVNAEMLKKNPAQGSTSPETPAQQTIRNAAASKSSATSDEIPDPPAIVNTNPYNLPSLPTEVKK